MQPTVPVKSRPSRFGTRGGRRAMRAMAMASSITMGRLTMDVLDVELAANSTPVLVGRQAADLGSLAIPIPRRESACCACRR